MIKLSCRPSTMWIGAGDCSRRRDIIRWGQEFPRGLLAASYASGNEFEEITIRTESQPWVCEIILPRNHASEADQRDYPGKYVRTAVVRGFNKNIRVLSGRNKEQLSSLIAMRQGRRLGFGDGIIPKSLKICTVEGYFVRPSGMGLESGERIVGNGQLTALPTTHFLLLSVPSRARRDCCSASRFAR
jgi:hypothetical protein